MDVRDIQDISELRKQITDRGDSISDLTPPLPDTSLTPLPVFSWDTEFSTESGKFDMDGHNPNNRLVCIGLTVVRGKERI